MTTQNIEASQPPCDTVRSRCGRARLSYHPEWSTERPWASYVDGTAGAHYTSASSGAAALGAQGFRFDTRWGRLA